MINLHDIRYLRIGTPISRARSIRDRDRRLAAGRARRQGRLFPQRQGRGARRHARPHAGLFRGRSRRSAIGFDLIDPDDLDAVGAELENAGHPVHLGTREECERAASRPSSRRGSERQQDRDRGAARITAACAISRRATPASPASAISGSTPTNAARDEAFWTRLCNARVSDWIGDAPLLRIATAHHSLALFPAHAQRRAAHQPSGRGHRRRDALLVLPQGEGREDPARSRAPSALDRGHALFPRAGRHGLRVFVGVKHIMPERGSDLPAAPIPASTSTPSACGARCPIPSCPPSRRRSSPTRRSAP